MFFSLDRCHAKYEGVKVLARGRTKNSERLDLFVRERLDVPAFRASLPPPPRVARLFDCQDDEAERLAPGASSQASDPRDTRQRKNRGRRGSWGGRGGRDTSISSHPRRSCRLRRNVDVAQSKGYPGTVGACGL